MAEDKKQEDNGAGSLPSPFERCPAGLQAYLQDWKDNHPKEYMDTFRERNLAQLTFNQLFMALGKAQGHHNTFLMQNLGKR